MELCEWKSAGPELDFGVDSVLSGVFLRAVGLLLKLTLENRYSIFVDDELIVVCTINKLQNLLGVLHRSDFSEMLDALSGFAHQAIVIDGGSGQGCLESGLGLGRRLNHFLYNVLPLVGFAMFEFLVALVNFRIQSLFHFSFLQLLQ